MLKSNLDNKKKEFLMAKIFYKSMKYFRLYSVYHFEAQNKRQKNQYAVC